jgi:hypothetical protein
VAITRARKHLTVVCDTSTICHSTFLARLLRHIRRYGQVKHVAPGSLDGVSGLGFNQPTLPSRLEHLTNYGLHDIVACIYCKELGCVHTQEDATQ